MANYEQIRQLIDRVRARWRALCALQAAVRASIAAAAILAMAVVAARFTTGAPVALVAIGAAAVILSAAAAAVFLWPLSRVPQDAAVARYIEERAPALDDRLV